MSASETKNIDVTNLAQAIGPLFPDGSIPGTKVDFDVPPGSIGTTELADGSVTAVKLANNSSGLYGARPLTGNYIGQICVDGVRRLHVGRNPHGGPLTAPTQSSASITPMARCRLLSPALTTTLQRCRRRLLIQRQPVSSLLARLLAPVRSATGRLLALICPLQAEQGAVQVAGGG